MGNLHFRVIKAVKKIWCKHVIPVFESARRLDRWAAAVGQHQPEVFFGGGATVLKVAVQIIVHRHHQHSSTGWLASGRRRRCPPFLFFLIIIFIFVLNVRILTMAYSATVTSIAAKHARHEWLIHSRLLLKKAVNLEPIRAPSVSRAGLWHADQKAFAESARFARRPILLVDDAMAAILALADGRNIAIRPSEEWLLSK